MATGYTPIKIYFYAKAFNRLRISIIIPTQNTPEYLAKLLPYLKENTSPEQVEEIVLVQEIETDQLIKLAERSHAKLYIFKNSSQDLKAEAGAFVAKGEILYFIKPGHFPPKDFAKRIICAVNVKKKLGTLYHPCVSRMCKFFNMAWMDRMVMLLSPVTNFFILRSFFHQIGGLKYNGKTYSFQEFLNKREFKSTLGIIQ